jgi:hypothetical protein
MKYLTFNNFDASDARKEAQSALNGASLEPGTFCRKQRQIVLRIRYGVVLIQQHRDG